MKMAMKVMKKAMKVMKAPPMMTQKKDNNTASKAKRDHLYNKKKASAVVTLSQIKFVIGMAALNDKAKLQEIQKLLT